MLQTDNRTMLQLRNEIYQIDFLTETRKSYRITETGQQVIQ